MNGRSSQLTAAEWQVMEWLWARSPRTGREAVDWLVKRVGWKRSTTLTLLRRLEDKGAVESVAEDGIKAFCPRIAREDAAMEEAENLLSRAYRGSVSLLVSALTRKQSLSQAEIDALHALLDGLEAEKRD